MTFVKLEVLLEGQSFDNWTLFIQYQNILKIFYHTVYIGATPAGQPWPNHFSLVKKLHEHTLV